MKLEDFLNNAGNRRQFLGSSAKNAAGVAAGMVSLKGSVATAAHDRVSVGVIGIRHQGQTLASTVASFPDVDVTAICDVDGSLLPTAAKAIQDIQGRAPRKEQDFRRLLDDGSLDAVLIATPDHWHALMTILACQAGKDVYVEKPVSHTIVEGETMVAAARTYQRVVQAGLQQRSGSHFISAMDFLHSGGLGRVNLAKAWTVHRRKSIGVKPPTSVPAEVDYDLWLGPAAEQPFTPNRFHTNWRWMWDFGTGELGNWGVHLLDVARWGLNVELPSRIAASGGRYHLDDDRETPDTLLVNYDFPGSTILWEHRMWSTHGLEGRNAAVAFYGEKGTLVLDRSGWKVYDRKEPVTAGSSELLAPHLRNFIDSVRTRQQPICEIGTGHISSSLCHLGNIAYRLGREVTFDPAAMNFGEDGEANALLSRPYRQPWQLPAV